MDTKAKEEPELTCEEKRKLLYFRQKNLLDTLLAHQAITQQQHDKSLHDLTVKMDMAAQ